MRTQSTRPYALRPMDLPDIDQVASIEREAFPTLWPPTSYKRELRNHTAEYAVCIHSGEYVSSSRKPHPKGLLRLLTRRNGVEPEAQQELITGFVGLWMMAGDAHIVAIAVREAYRRQGLGELLLIGAIEMAQRRDQEMVTLEVRISNDAARLLYEKYGFRQAGYRKAYYADNHEDAYIMSTDSIRSADFQEYFDQRRAEFQERYGHAERRYL